MNIKMQRTLALLAATALTSASLVACAPQASTNTSTQKAESSATSQPSETASPKQTEEKSSESTSPTASSSTSSTSNSSASTPQTEQPDATTTETTSPEPTPTQAGITGWLEGACSSGSTSSFPGVTSATLSGSTLTIEGDMQYTETESRGITGDRSSWVSGPMTFTVDESTMWQTRGGLAGTTSVEPDQLLQMVNSHSGLGLIIQAESGVVRSITISS